MFSALFGWLKGLFGVGKEESKEASVKKAAKIAGLFVAANNQSYVPLAKAALEDVQGFAENGAAKMVVNKAFKDALDKIADNVKDRAKILAVFTILGIDPGNNVTIPNVELPLIEAAVEGFLEGFAV